MLRPISLLRISFVNVPSFSISVVIICRKLEYLLPPLIYSSGMSRIMRETRIQGGQISIAYFTTSIRRRGSLSAYGVYLPLLCHLSITVNGVTSQG